MLRTDPFLFTVLFDGYREVGRMSNTLSPNDLLRVLSLDCCSVTQSSPTLCNPMGCSMPGLPVFHHISEFAQTHVHWVSDAIQPSHPLPFPSPPAFCLSQNQGLSNEPALCIRWPKYGSFSFNISPSNEYSGLISFRIDWFDLLAVQGALVRNPVTCLPLQGLCAHLSFPRHDN